MKELIFSLFLYKNEVFLEKCEYYYASNAMHIVYHPSFPSPAALALCSDAVFLNICLKTFLSAVFNKTLCPMRFSLVNNTLKVLNVEL